jgi:hypothetical protein
MPPAPPEAKQGGNRSQPQVAYRHRPGADGNLLVHEAEHKQEQAQAGQDRCHPEQVVGVATQIDDCWGLPFWGV